MNCNREKRHKITVLFLLGLVILTVLAIGKNLLSANSKELYKTNEIVHCNSNNYKWKVDPSSIYEVESIFNKSNERMLEFVNVKENSKEEPSEITRVMNLLLERNQRYKNFKYNYESKDVIFRYQPIGEGPFLFCSFRNGKLHNELDIYYQGIKE